MARTVGGLWCRIVDWENVLWAVHRTIRGKRDRASVRQFLHRLDENVAELIADLAGGKYRVGPYERFVVYDPKRREIFAPALRDRIVHHSMLNLCEPAFERRMIHDSYACRCGKGQHAAVRRAAGFAKQHPFFLKMDIRRFFDSIDHDVVGQQLRNLFRERSLLALFDRIVASHHTQPGKGLPIGALTSQFLANSYLNPVDRFVKEDLRMPGYVRYMDDFVVWGGSSRQLKEILNRITALLDERLALRLKPEPYIQRSEPGMDFLGYRVFPGWIGLSRRSRRRYERKIRALEYAEESGLSEGDVQCRLQALTQFAVFARCWHFRRNVLQKIEGQVERSRHGPESGHAGRQLEQQRRELPLGQPEQERA